MSTLAVPMAAQEIDMIGISLPLRSSLWAGALHLGAAPGRSGQAARRHAKAKLHVLQPALGCVRSDPGFPQALYAAAERHERSGGA
jgi:hypothetical protein